MYVRMYTLVCIFNIYVCYYNAADMLYFFILLRSPLIPANWESQRSFHY